MRFLADESCDFAVVRALREAQHDVVAIVEISPRAEDPEVVRMAVEQDRIRLTEDKDFGQLVFAHGRRSAGVILIRYPASARQALPAAVLDLIKRSGALLDGKFVVLRPGRIRIVSGPGA